jgi:hypothetical protein
MRPLLVGLLLLFAAPVRADLAAAGLAKKHEVASKRCGALPARVSYSGGSDRACHTFSDKNGDNYVLFSSQSSTRKVADEDEQTVALYVDVYAVQAGKARVLRKVRDKVDCIFDLTALFDPAGFHVTDIDEDGIAEVSFAYEIGCRSDVSANELKLLLLEGGTKYILRGKTRIQEGGEPDTGRYTVDPSFDKGPRIFLDYAKQLWQDVVDDEQIGPR